jgi:hypothetical protein
MKEDMQRPTDEDWDDTLRHLTRHSAARVSLKAAYQEYQVNTPSAPQPHHSWDDIVVSATSASVLKLIRQIRRMALQGADPLEPSDPHWLQNAAQLLEQIGTRAHLRAEFYRPRSRLERLISRVCDAWAADGREVKLTKALIAFVVSALEPVHPLGPKRVTLLVIVLPRRAADVVLPF